MPGGLLPGVLVAKQSRRGVHLATRLHDDQLRKREGDRVGEGKNQTEVNLGASTSTDTSSRDSSSSVSAQTNGSSWGTLPIVRFDQPDRQLPPGPDARWRCIKRPALVDCFRKRRLGRWTFPPSASDMPTGRSCHNPTFGVAHPFIAGRLVVGRLLPNSFRAWDANKLPSRSP